MSNEGKNAKRPNPNAAKATGGGGNSPYGEFRFIEGYLDADDQQWLADNADSAAECVLSLVADLCEGYKLSVSWDKRTEMFLATLTCSLDGSADKGKILTSRGSTPVNAAFALWYRHYRKFPNGWGESNVRRSDFA